VKKGDVILVSFPFTDLNQTKKRPALVLAVTGSDVTVAFITSNTAGAPHDVLLRSGVRNGLRTSSMVKTTKLATLADSLVWGRLGELNTAEMEEVDNGLRQALQL
jgi:mRNA interferase MazF